MRFNLACTSLIGSELTPASYGLSLKENVGRQKNWKTLTLNHITKKCC